DIPGIGAGRRKALLRALGSLKRIREAPLEELARVEGFGPKAAQAVWDFFHGPGAPAAPEPEPGPSVQIAAEPSAGGAAAPGPVGLEVSEADIDAALAEEATGEAG
ncbi:MAG TPA: helix-hairpin-helix domain-containing protein, partial [Anaeromyxobacteraceae bacterium]